MGKGLEVEIAWLIGETPLEGNGIPLQYSCLQNPMNTGLYQTTVHRVAKSCTLFE